MATKQSTLIRRQIDLPIELFDLYAERAIKYGTNAEDEIVKTLSRCRQHNATQAIYLDDAQRGELSQLAGRTIAGSGDVIAWAKQLISLKVGGVEVPLSTQLASRLSSRRFGKTWDEMVKQAVTESLEQLVGLR